MNFSELKASFHAGDVDKPSYIRQSCDLHQALFDYVAVTQTTDVREIRICPDGVSFLMGDAAIRLYAPAQEARVAPLEVMNFGRYEPAETRVMDLICEQAGCILDIGANIGWFAVRFAHRLPKAQVYAFEPLPESFQYLQRNIAANGVGGRVSAFNYGLSDTSGAVTFFLEPANGTNASLLNVSDASTARRIVGLTLTLDEWAANHRVTPDFIKCDVEGAELLVFRGGQRLLEQHKPAVFAELLRKWSKPFGYHPTDMIKFFSSIGYDCFAVGESGVRRITEVTDATPETNYAFLHREKHADLARTLETSS